MRSARDSLKRATVFAASVVSALIASGPARDLRAQARGRVAPAVATAAAAPLASAGTPPAPVTSTTAATPGAGLPLKNVGDTQSLTQFESGMDYAPRGMNERVSFSLEDANLPELVRVIGELTGKRFILEAKFATSRRPYSPLRR